MRWTRWTLPLTALAAVLASLSITACGSDSDSGPTLTATAVSPISGSGFESVLALDGATATTAYTGVRAASGTTLPSTTWKDGDTLTLNIFHFNDFHHRQVVTHATKGDTRYFAQMVKQVKAARAAATSRQSVLFVAGGDDHIGTVLDELLGSDTSSFVMSPAYRAYSAAGLDAAVLGNHEFDKGTALLAKMISSDARFPVLSANVQNSKVLSSQHVHPAMIGVTKGLRVGIIGLTTPEETKTGFAEDPTLTFAGVLSTLRNTAPAVATQSDVLIVMSHVGFNGTDASGARHVIPEGDIEIAKYLATLGKPAIVIGGHTHSVLNANGLEAANVIDGVPIVQAGSWGAYLGEVKIDVTRTNGKITATPKLATLHALKSRDIRVAATDPNYNNYEQDTDVDLAFQSTVMAPMFDQLRTRLAETLGTTTQDTEMSTASTIADRYVGESAIANFMNDAVVARSSTFPGGKVDFAVFNASGVAAGVPLGATITFNDWYAVMPYADIIRIVSMTGQQIKDMLNSNAKRFVRPGETVNLSGFVSRGMLHFSSGVRYTVSLGASANVASATNISLGGAPIDTVLTKTFRVAFSDYISNGNEGWKGTTIGAGLPADIIGYDLKSFDDKDTGLVYRNEIVAYIKEKGSVSPATGAHKDGRLTVTP